MRFTPTILLMLAAACGGSPTPEVASPPQPVAVSGTPFPPVPPDAAPADAQPEAAPEVAAEPAIGAMPVPPADAEDWYSQPPTIDELDTTITEADLPATDGTWRKPVKVAKGGAEVWLALHVNQDNAIMLSVVEDDTGIHEQWKLGVTDTKVNNHTFDGTTFPSPQRTDVSDGYRGPIVFAIRIAPRGKPVHQFVVFFAGRSVFVADRPLGTTAWTRRLRLDFKRGSTFIGIGTTDPH